jgi:hypothetical protein
LAQAIRSDRTGTAKTPTPKENLGRLVVEYHHKEVAGWFAFTLVLGVAGIISPAMYGFQRYQYAYTNFGPVAAQHWSRIWFLLAALAGVIFILLLILRARRSRLIAVVYRRGLCLKPGFGKARTLTWRQIAGIAASTTHEHFFGIPLGIHQSVTLYPVLGRPIRLSADLERLPELAARIKASLYRRLAQDLRMAFEAGQWLFFGPVAIQKNALQLQRPWLFGRGKQVYQWKQVDQITIQNGFLVIEWADPLTRRKFSRILASQIPNVELLVQIIQQGVKV